MKNWRLPIALLSLIAAVALFIAAGLPTKLHTMITLYREDGLAAVYYRAKTYLPRPSPNVRWETATPESEGMDPERLEALRDSLAIHATRALLVARDGRIILEWYGPSFGPNTKLSLAALAKGVAGNPILLAAASDGLIGLDDRVVDYVPEWSSDPQRAQVTIRQLASHSSGMDDVDFNATYTGWKAEYLDHSERRFRMAIETTPILYPPGTRAAYSGVGYYVLAYALGRALAREEEPTDLRSFLRDRVMRPIGVPTEDWTLSYGESYEIDGMTLRAIGSGAEYTARAAARIGELYLRGGEWNGRQVIRADLVRQALSYSNSPPEPDPEASNPPAGLGWWVNSTGYFASLPPDAAIAFGGEEQILLLVPSLHLLAIRLGGPLEEPDNDPWGVAERQFLGPVLQSVVGPSSGRPGP